MRTLRKILIAHRGEIACRIARTCRRLGLAVATVHSSADRSALHVREIGESIEIGGPAAASYSWRPAASAAPEPSSLPSLLLQAGGTEWAVRCSRRAPGGSMRIAIGDMDARAAVLVHVSLVD